jgi:hypothetical protein
MLDVIGGRKFLMAIILIAAGIVIEIYGKNGLSTNMASMLAGIYAIFSGSNALITNKQLAVEGSLATTEPPSLQALPPSEPALSRSEAEQIIGAIAPAFEKMQAVQMEQAEHINMLQKVVLDKARQ